MDVGQYENFAVNVIGGTAPFTYNFLVFNSVTGSEIAQASYADVGSATNTFLWQVTNSVLGNTISANVVVTDSSSLTATLNFSNYYNTNTIVIASGVMGDQPYGVAFAPDGTFAYVTDQAADIVSVVDTETNTVVNTIAVGTMPFGVAFDPSGTLAYVANEGSNNVSVIDTATDNVVNSINVGDTPSSVAFNPSGTFAYVTNSGDGTVSVINVAENETVNLITVGNDPFDVAFSPYGSYAYDVNLADGTVSVIDVEQNQSVGQIVVGDDPVSIAFSPNGQLAYAVNLADGTVSAISTSTNTVIDTISVGNGPIGIAFSPSGAVAYVVNSNDGTVSVINTSTSAVINTVTVGSGPITAAFSPNGSFAYVTNSNDDTLTSIISPFFQLIVYPQISVPSISPAGLTIHSAQGVTFSSSWTGGAPNYTASLYSSATSPCNSGSTLLQAVQLKSNSLTFNSVNAGSSTYFCILVSDSATTPATESSNNSFVQFSPVASTLTTTFNYATGGAPPVTTSQSSTVTTTVVSVSTTTTIQGATVQTTVPSTQNVARTGAGISNESITETSPGITVSRNGPSCLDMYNLTLGSGARIIVNGYALMMSVGNLSQASLSLEVNNNSYDLEKGTQAYLTGPMNQEFNFSLLGIGNRSASLSLCAVTLQSKPVTTIQNIPQSENTTETQNTSQPFQLYAVAAVVAALAAIYALFRFLPKR